MEHLKGELRASDVPDLSQSAALNGCNLLDSSLEEILSIDEIMASICSDRRKKPGKRLVRSTKSHINYCLVLVILVFIKPSIYMNFHDSTYALDRYVVNQLDHVFS